MFRKHNNNIRKESEKFTKLNDGVDKEEIRMYTNDSLEN